MTSIAPYENVVTANSLPDETTIEIRQIEHGDTP